MANAFDLYFLKSKGLIVEVVFGGEGTIQVDGEAMTKLDESSRSGAVEKHTPVIEKTESGFRIKVGSLPHSMDASHYTQWIEIIVDDNKIYRQLLKPGDPSEATFELKNAKKVVARAFCNLHGLWESKLE